MTTPRESLLLLGTYDWVALDHIHRETARHMPGSLIPQIQQAALELIREVVEQGLFEMGDVTAERGFVRWLEPTDQAISRIEGFYIDAFDDTTVWPWCCWLNLTPHGEQIAHELSTRQFSTDS
ncbi:hypothetical protein FK535_06810 [Mycolicibacterium sp. 018/SC-01/001]|uniref:hypothetical protein n=1 Tax=Mycolicibacterium sp. 018/SC-01/001 TaxID=2592069 RepID=UPI001180EA86|nr:hypothetical protein [Mycolicibacterium sp. 018/SC-01/001]TRW86181.1 hypothetical protein FK535_06810 [Mycolicibacterium sp. 018/SC-01/001]